MKTFKPMVPVLLVLLPACQRQDAPAPPALVEHTLYASAAPGEYTPASRTVLDEANDKNDKPQRQQNGDEKEPEAAPAPTEA